MVVVSSGAIAAGRERLQFPQLPKEIPAKQMIAAVGQPRLMALYEQLFGLYQLTIAQVLLTRRDLKDRRQYLNSRNTQGHSGFRHKRYGGAPGAVFQKERKRAVIENGGAEQNGGQPDAGKNTKPGAGENQSVAVVHRPSGVPTADKLMELGLASLS